MSECRIRSFRATWSNWDISWGSSRSKIILPVSFRLELEPGSSKSDCVVGQLKRGRAAIGGDPGKDVWNDWVGDSEWPSGWWWSGERLALTGKGKWDTVGCGGGPETVATFSDSPGFGNAPAGQSLFYGSAVGSGYFDFKTFVKQKTGGLAANTLAEINWSMRIDVPTPGKGGSWWSYSDQK